MWLSEGKMFKSESRLDREKEKLNKYGIKYIMIVTKCKIHGIILNVSLVCTQSTSNMQKNRMCAYRWRLLLLLLSLLVVYHLGKPRTAPIRLFDSFFSLFRSDRFSTKNRWVCGLMVVLMRVRFIKNTFITICVHGKRLLYCYCRLIDGKK